MRPGSASSTTATGVPGCTWPRLFSVISAVTQMSWIVISVITGLPAAANWPVSVRRSVTSPADRARTWVLDRSSSAFSTAPAALRSLALSSALPPSCSIARCTSARDAATLLVACSRSARAISSRRSEMVPASSRYSRSSRSLSCRALTSSACAARSEARADSMPAVLAPICRRVASRSARARSTAIRYCPGSTSNSMAPACTSWLLRTCTRVTRPDTSEATGTTNA